MRIGDIIYTAITNDEATTGTGSSSGPNALPRDYSGVIDILPFVNIDDKKYRVTEIGRYSFFGCSAATGVKIPSTVIVIKTYAFSSMKLDEIILPGSIMQIDYLGIDECQNTKLIIFCGKKSAELSSDVSAPISTYYTVPVKVPLDYIGTTFCKKNAEKVDLSDKCKFKNYNTNNALCTIIRCRKSSYNSLFAYVLIELSY